jgi:hypothetical protein
MTISCISANSPTTPGGVTAPIGLTAQSMTITPAATPCYDPCTIYVDVTWINDTTGTIGAGTTVGINLDSTINAASTTTPSAVIPGDKFSHTFTLIGLISSNPNLICPNPN